jgi:hypothetical protein
MSIEYWREIHYCAKINGAIPFCAPYKTIIMPKQLAEKELVEILERIGRHPDGIGLESLHNALSSKFSRRTLQRRLALLTEQQRIVAEGAGRGVRYRRLPCQTDLSVQDGLKVVARPVAEAYIPISPEAEEIKGYLRQPIQQRRPVGWTKPLRGEQQHRPVNLEM